jgi:23S rRNA A2030 N6-methylase RlmJ
MLMSRSLLARALEEYDEYGQMVVALEATNHRYMGGRIKLTRRFEVQHLDGYEMAFANLGPSEYPGLIYPVEQMPADTGTVLPPSLQEEVA